MADAAVAKQDVGVDNKVTIWTWAPLTQGSPAGVDLGPNFMEYVDRTVQVEGNFDGASVLMEGSNDGANYHTLTDPLGVPVSKSAPSLTQLTETCAHMRPRVTGATANTSIVVTISARKGHR